MKLVPWLVAGLIFTGAWWMVAGAKADALKEQGRVVELIRLRELAETEAAEARATATHYADSVAMARLETERVRQEAAQTASEARRSAFGASARLRTLLDSLGASTAPLDSLEVAHAVEVAAKDSVIAAQDRQILAVDHRVSLLELALDKADERTLAVAAERDSYKRQAELWQSAQSPSLVKRLGTTALAFGVGYLAGRL